MTGELFLGGVKIFGDTGIFRHNQAFSEPCVTLAYPELLRIENQRLIQNPVRHLKWSVLRK